MALETGTYVNALVTSNPASTDGLAQADDHIRLIKTTLKNTLPNATGAITASHSELNALDGSTATTAELNVLSGLTATTAELNYTDGVTSNVQTQLDAKAPTASPTFTGDATFAGTVGTPTVDLGDWTITQTGSDLVFSHSGTARFKLSSGGALVVEGDVTAFGDA